MYLYVAYLKLSDVARLYSGEKSERFFAKSSLLMLPDIEDKVV